MTPRLKERYENEILPQLAEKLGRKNRLSLPKLEKIVVSMGVGSALTDKKHMEDATSALAEITGSFEEAVAESGRVLAVYGRVLPSTLTDVRLLADLAAEDGKILHVSGETQIRETEGAIKRLWLDPANTPAFPPAISAVLSADLILSTSNPMIVVPSISITGTPICPVFSIISCAAAWSTDTSNSLNSTLFSSRYDFIFVHHGQPGAEYTFTSIITTSGCFRSFSRFIA